MMTESMAEESKENKQPNRRKRKLPWQVGIFRRMPVEYIACMGSFILAIGIYILCLAVGKEKISGPLPFFLPFLFFVIMQIGYAYDYIKTKPVTLILHGIGMIMTLVANLILTRQLMVTEEPDYTICYVILILTFVIPMLVLLRAPRNYRWLRTINIIKSVLFGIVTLFAAFFIIEQCSGTDIKAISTDHWWYNLLFMLLIAGLAYILTFRIRTAFTVLLVFALVAGLANGYVIQFRGSPILPADLYLMKTAMEVSGGYDYMPTSNMWIGISFFIFALMLVWSMREPIMSHKKRLIGRGIALLPYVVILLIGLNSFTAKVNSQLYMLNLWMPISTYQRYGTSYGFGMNLIALQVHKPDNYSQSKVEEVLKDYTSDGETVTTKPNIIVVLCEAFSDPGKIGDFETNEEYLSYFNSLSDNVIKGTAYSSVLGGTTADSEYELLTGNAITYLPAGTVPYQQYIHDETLNLTRTLKSLGYSAEALHPYSRNTYRREIVYPLLGFDQYYDMTFIKSPEYLRYYIKDSTDFNKIIDLYENRDTSKPFYLYNVTMQNHSPYDLGKMDYNIQVQGGDYPQANEYLSCISATDEALPILIDYFSQVKEPTYILFVGDHQPNLYDGFLENLYGTELTSLTLEQLQKRYTVPFFIWSNQDIEEKQVDAISMNYLSSYFLKEAGMPLTAYNKYLLDLHEKYPVININGYMDQDKVWHDTMELRQNEDLIKYNMLVYNSVVNNNKDVEWAYSLKK